MRSLVRYKQLEYKKAEAGLTEGVPGASVDSKNQAEVTALDYDIVRKDLDHVIQLAPDFVYGYYNRANVLSLLKDYRGALVDYDKAIELNKDFAEAYFNRGLTHIFLGNNKQGITDLSKQENWVLFLLTILLSGLPTLVNNIFLLKNKISKRISYFCVLKIEIYTTL